MAFVFYCPQCASTLKTGMPVEPGRAIQCPKCGHMFTAAETAVQAEDPGLFPPQASPIDMPSVAEMAPLLPSDEPRSRRSEENERTSGREDRDEPRRRPRSEDERDRNRNRDRDRPSSRDREDDYPRRSRHREDDDYLRRRRYEDDDRDRPRRRPPQGSNRTALIVVLLVVGLIIAAGIFLFDAMDDDQDVASKPFAPGIDTEMLAVAPPDTVVLAGIDVDQLRTNGKFSRAIGDLIFSNMPDRAKFENDLRATGLTENDVSGIMLAGTEPGGSGMVAAIRFNRDVDRSRIVKATHARRHTDDFKTYYTSGARLGGGFFFAGKRMIVFAQQHSTLIELLHHDRNEIRVGQDLRDLAVKAQGVYWAVVRKDGGAAAMQGLGGFGAEDLFEGVADQSDAMLVSFSARNDQLDCDVGMKVKANKDAQDIVRQMQAELPMRRLALNNPGLAADERALELAVVQTATFRTDGPIAYVKFRVGIDLFARFVQNARGN